MRMKISLRRVALDKGIHRVAVSKLVGGERRILFSTLVLLLFQPLSFHILLSFFLMNIYFLTKVLRGVISIEDIFHVLLIDHLSIILLHDFTI